MANQSIDPKALASFSIASIVFPDEGAGFDSRSEWSRIASELEQQEKKKDEEKKDSSTSSDLKFFRVDQADKEGGEPMRWLFPISIKLIKNDPYAPPATLLERKMADEIDSLYRLHGSDEVARLSVSIDTTYQANQKALDDRYADGTREQEEQFDDRDELLTAVRLVESVYRQQLDVMLNRIREHEKQVQEAAVKVALDKLQEAGLEILTETTRYVGLGRNHTVSAQKALETVSDPLRIRLSGPDFPALLEAVGRIRSRIAAVDNPPPAKQELVSRTDPLLATSPAEDAAHALELELSQACRRFPILHRTWKTLRVTENTPIPTNFFPYRNKAEYLAANARLDTILAIFGVLRTAWEANQRMRERIVNKPDVVWLFPPLIHETLEQLAVENPEYGDLEVGARAAQEKLKLEDPNNRITALLAQIAGFLEFAAVLTSPAPPIALTIAGASLVFSLTDSLVEYQLLSAQDDAANSTLDPRKALASDPSYGFFALGLALSLLDLKGIKNAYKAARVTREVDELGKLVQEGL